MAEAWRRIASSSDGRSIVEECYLPGERRMTRKRINRVSCFSGLPYRLRIYQHCVAVREMQAYHEGLVCISDVKYKTTGEVQYMMVGEGTGVNSACTLYTLLKDRRRVVSMATRIDLMHQMCKIVSCLQRNL